MTPSINKYFLGLCFLIGTLACSQPQEPVIDESETIVVEAEPQTPPVKVETPANEPTLETQASTQTSAVPAKAAAAKTLYPNEVILRLKAWDKNLNTLKTAFTQNTYYDGVPISMSHGNLFYNKQGGLLRLDTLNEDERVEQSAVTNKKELIILDGQGRQITTLSWQEWQQGQPNQALFDFGNYTALLDRHHVELKEPHVLVLTPKEGEDHYTLTLTLDKEDFFPVLIEIKSDLTVTQAALENIQKNTRLDFEIFGGFF